MADGQPQARELAAYLDGLARLGGAVSAIEVLVADDSQIRFRHAAGYRLGGEPLAPGARFDAASLTKPWMATLALALEEEKSLALATPLTAIFGVQAATAGGATLEDLLRHRSGIAAWTPLGPKLGKCLTDRAALASFLLTSSLWQRSPATSPMTLYSDLGYILWGLAVEKVTGDRLSDVLDRYVCEPLDLAPLGALAGKPPAEQIVECRLDNWKEVELAAEQGMQLTRQAPFLRGVPQDGNARAIGVLTGHAGLFVTADEQLALGREWLRPERVLTRAAVDRTLAGEGAFALGWARQSDDGSSGPALTPSAFGHTGFTGGSLWLEPARQRIVVILAHRLSSRLDLNPIRREIHRLAGQI